MVMAPQYGHLPHKDFAVGFVGLLGNPKAINETFHITSDEWLTWNQIYNYLAKALGVTPNLIHIPSKTIAKYDANYGAGLLGDKANSLIFDNSKLKKVVPEFDAQIPFEQGAREMVQWYQENEDRYEVDNRINDLYDKLIKDFSKL